VWSAPCAPSSASCVAQAGQTRLTWRAPAFCDGGNCVQVTVSKDLILISDSKKPDDPVRAYTRAEWTRFVEGAKKGDFDGFLSRVKEIELGDREVMLPRDEKHNQPMIEPSCR